MTRPLVRVVFGLLVAATIAAFFLTQQLKSENELVQGFAAQPTAFSPNADGFADSAQVGFRLSEPAKVSFAILNADGSEVRRLRTGEQLARGKHLMAWDGRDDDGSVVADGEYRMRLIRRDEGRVINSLKHIEVDTKPPKVTLRSASPGVIAVGEPDQNTDVTLRYRGPRNKAPVFRVYRTDVGAPRLVRRFRGDRSRSGVWDGRLSDGPDATRPAPEGDYTFTVTARDRAGNPGVSPAETPTERLARAGTGVSVRRFTLRGPLGVTPAGRRARLEVGPFARSFDFVISRLGDPRPVRRGGRIGGEFVVGIPADATTGVYLVRVRAGAHRAVWPLVVQGRAQTKRAAARDLPLVVLPAISWQGLNRVDDDLDGFADSLPRGGSARLDRPFAGAGLPPRFAAEIEPFLRYLDREKLGYDLTTDVSLARRKGPSMRDARGVAFVGSALWLPAPVLRELRDQVKKGMHMASFGADAFRRSVRLRGARLVEPTPPRPVNIFGEGTSLERTSEAPLDVLQEGLGLFDGLTGLFGNFTVYERSRGTPEGAELLAAAGRPDTGSGEDVPAFVAYRIGRGIAVRGGTPQWAAELDERRLSLEVPALTRRIWRLLGRGIE